MFLELRHARAATCHPCRRIFCQDICHQSRYHFRHAINRCRIWHDVRRELPLFPDAAPKQYRGIFPAIMANITEAISASTEMASFLFSIKFLALFKIADGMI